MNRIFPAVLFFLLFTFLSVEPAFAHTDRANIKGLVSAVDPIGVLTILTSQGEQVMVIIPGGFKTVSFEAGDSVLVTGIFQSDGAVLAASIKKVDRLGADPLHGELVDAYCVDGKLLKPHPLAVRLGETTAVSSEWVMGYFCSGHSMGDIMLALKTEGLYQIKADLLLTQLTAGSDWGQIWSEAGWIGSPNEAKSPPGWLTRP